MSVGAVHGLNHLFRRYAGSNDTDAVRLAQAGDHIAAEFLLYKYRNLVRNKVKSYFLLGGEKDDLLQVGMIGLWQAIVDYRFDHSISFSVFAKVCIQRHIITAIKAATRHKQMMLNNSLSLERTPEPNAQECDLMDVLVDMAQFDPEKAVLCREDTRELHGRLQAMLSEFEWKVLNEYQVGRSYREIAVALRCKTKSVDNALARIKRKVAGVPLGEANLTELLVRN